MHKRIWQLYVENTKFMRYLCNIRAKFKFDKWFTGQFSLGHAGFMAIGAYTTALLTIPTEMKTNDICNNTYC